MSAAVVTRGRSQSSGLRAGPSRAGGGPGSPRAPAWDPVRRSCLQVSVTGVTVDRAHIFGGKPQDARSWPRTATKRNRTAVFFSFFPDIFSFVCLPSLGPVLRPARPRSLQESAQPPGGAPAPLWASPGPGVSISPGPSVSISPGRLSVVACEAGTVVSVQAAFRSGLSGFMPGGASHSWQMQRIRRRDSLG